MEAGASNIEVLLRCTKTSMIKSETKKVLLEIDLWELALKKLDEMLVPSERCSNDLPNENGNSTENKEKTKKDNLAGIRC